MMSEVMRSILNQMALDEPGGEVRVNPAHLNELLDIIIRNTNKLSKLTNNVLDITKIESNSLILDKEPIDMRKFLYDSIVDFNNQLLINGKKYTSDPKTSENIENEIVKLIFHEDEVIESNKNGSLPTQKFVVEIDKSRILQVLTNLIDNAIDSVCHQASKKVSVMLVYKNNKLTIQVTDTGCGIPSDTMNQIFKKGFSTKGTSRGFGLHLVKQTIDELGGQIVIDSFINSGTTFYIDIPYETRRDQVD